MGKNTSANKGQPLFRIEGRPDEHNRVIQRQGQFARIMRAQICPCNDAGHPDIFDTKCNGKGYLFSHQKYIRVTDENSPHGIEHAAVIKPFFVPVKKVHKILAMNSLDSDNSTVQGELTVKSFNDEEIYLDSNQILPHRYQSIRATYDYLRFDQITETISGTGAYKVELQKTKIGIDKDDQFIPNFNNFFADIVSVDSCNFDIVSFYKSYIVFNPLNPAPQPTEDITVTYWIARPFKVVITNITSQMVQENEVFSAMDAGDAMIEVEGTTDVGSGDLVTLYATTERRSEILYTSNVSKQELSEFDVKRIVGFIIDEDGVEYENEIDFELDNYNFIYWKAGANKPADGKKISVLYDFYVTYRIMRQLPTSIGQENKQWPKTFLAKKYTRMFKKQREDIKNVETSSDASGSTVNVFEDIDL